MKAIQEWPPKGLKYFYADDAVVIIHGDSREKLPMLGPLESIITDPVWPNAAVDLVGKDDPGGLFSEMCQAVVSTDRLVVQLGCDTDPRFLATVPAAWPFLRVCWLDYARPSYKGRLLYTGDVAYAFGVPPAFIKGRQVMSGMCRSAKSDKLFHRKTHNKRGRDFDRQSGQDIPHPTPRRLQHVSWLVHQFSDNFVVDPFAGSCTVAVAAKSLGRKCICIEIKEEFCELGATRLRQEYFDFNQEPQQ